MINVLIVDDHIALCDLFKKAFEGDENFYVIGELNEAALSPAFCKRKKPDLILMDVCADGKACGLDAAEEIKAAFPDIKIILMSGFDEISFIPRAKSIGAEGFIYKSESLDFFMKIAREVMEGKTYFPEPKHIPLPIGEMPFTKKEMTILRLICECKSRKEISDQLNISENTVKYHIANMLGKTGLTSTAELAVYVVSGGWINPRF